VPTVVEYDSLEEPQLSPIDTQHVRHRPSPNDANHLTYPTLAMALDLTCS